MLPSLAAVHGGTRKSCVQVGASAGHPQCQPLTLAVCDPREARQRFQVEASEHSTAWFNVETGLAVSVTAGLTPADGVWACPLASPSNRPMQRFNAERVPAPTEDGKPSSGAVRARVVHTLAVRICLLVRLTCPTACSPCEQEEGFCSQRGCTVAARPFPVWRTAPSTGGSQALRAWRRARRNALLRGRAMRSCGATATVVVSGSRA